MSDGVAVPSESAAELRRRPLGLGLLSLYGSGAAVDTLVTASLGNFLFFYLTIVCGLSNSLAGFSLFVALVFDALIDPFVGSLSDNSSARLGRRHPFMFTGILPLAIGLGLLFSIPTGLKGAALFAYATIVSIGLRMSHSVFFLPYVGLGAELSDDYAERTNIVASRFLFSVIGTGAVLALGYGVFLTGTGKYRHAAYVPFGWICGALALVIGLIAAFGTLRALPRLHKVAKARGSLAGRFFRDIVEIFRNRSFVALFLSLLLLFIGAGTATTIYLHTATFFWRMPSWAITAVALAVVPGTLLGVPISVFIANRVEKRVVVIACFLILVTYHAMITVLRIVGALPPNGIALYGLLIGLGLVIGAVVACAGIGFQSMMADAADEHEFMFGTRREGLYYAGLNFSAKAATGVGALVAGVALDLIHFPTNLATKGGPNVHIDQAVIDKLGLLYGPGVAAIYGLATLAFLLYRLDRPRYLEIQKALDGRRLAATGAEARAESSAPR